MALAHGERGIQDEGLRTLKFFYQICNQFTRYQRVVYRQNQKCRYVPVKSQNPGLYGGEHPFRKGRISDCVCMAAG